MKNIKILILVAVIALTAFSCKNETQPEVIVIKTAGEEVGTTLNPNATYAKAEFTIEGMTCAMGCAKAIEKKMAKMEGVKSATVDFDRQLAMVEYDEAKVTPTSLEGTVTSVADLYKVKDMKIVDAFSKKACKVGCKKDCCANKKEVKNTTCSKDCKKDCCKNKSEIKKTACSKDCKKACCVKEVKV